MIIWNILKKVGIIILFILYLGYIFFKAPIFEEFGIVNLIEYVLVLLAAGHFLYSLLKKEVYPLFRKK
ncbi:hypothetical protein JOC37_001531 [Desulfohalotomaculum tongense]|uniref:hypothetical protein n=1 Tax=Desulforadius tongensis TaxID=1216062 RepID=UPI001959A500|nr:hypothetical protein [Desulforadius tongensis]MBM7855146.1 hypothetical protein [Desulforadius tongensis]